MSEGRRTASPVVRARRVGAGQDRVRLDAFVRDVLDGATPVPLSNADVRRVIVGGGVEVDGRLARAAGAPVRQGQLVRITLRADRLASQRARPGGEAREVRVLFLDESIVAADKPPGLPTVPTPDARRASLVDLVAHALATEGGPARLGVHQRLDADTSGVVVFSRTREAGLGLDAAFADRRVTKTYLALAVTGPDGWPPDGRVRDRLDTSGRGKRGRVAASATGRVAETHVTVLEGFRGVALVQVSPLTGRKHQVRAHLAGIGCPLLGDARYGGPTRVLGRAVPRVMLHASRLEVPHPVTGAPLRLESPLPGDLSDLLSWLRQRAGRRSCGGRAALDKSLGQAES